jgi:hypothetical protein
MTDVPGPPGPKPPVGWYWWPLWVFLHLVGLFFFYVVMTPVWVGIRFVAWLSERSSRGR